LYCTFSPLRPIVSGNSDFLSDCGVVFLLRILSPSLFSCVEYTVSRVLLSFANFILDYYCNCLVAFVGIGSDFPGILVKLVRLEGEARTLRKSL
jgi:hypothetical protein